MVPADRSRIRQFDRALRWDEWLTDDLEIAFATISEDLSHVQFLPRLNYTTSPWNGRYPHWDNPLKDMEAPSWTP